MFYNNHKANDIFGRYDLKSGTLLSDAQKTVVLEAMEWVKKRNKKKFLTQKIESLAIYYLSDNSMSSYLIGHVMVGSVGDPYFRIHEQN